MAEKKNEKSVGSRTSQEKDSTFKVLSAINVNEHTEQKQGLTYLSWAWAWGELMKKYPDAKYEIERFDGKPYLFDEGLGYMVFTKVTIADDTKEMWLPVMDATNRAMLDEEYEWYDRYNKPHKVAKATMFDINKTIMRCLVKNIGMFGLGLYIYAGEDLPETDEVIEEEKKAPQKAKKEPQTVEEVKEELKKPIGMTPQQIETLSKLDESLLKWVADKFRVDDWKQLSMEQAEWYIEMAKKRGVLKDD